MPAFFMKNFKLRPEFFEINQNLSRCHTEVRLDIDSFWDNHLGSYENVEDFAECVASRPGQYRLDVDTYGMTKEEILSSEEFMSCFVYGGEHNYFFRKPNW